MKPKLSFTFALIPLLLIAAPNLKPASSNDKPLEPEKVISESLTKQLGKAAKKTTSGTNHEVQNIRFAVIEKENVPTTVILGAKVKRSNGKQGDVNAKIQLIYDSKNKLEAISPELTLGKLTFRPSKVGPAPEFSRLNDVFDRLTTVIMGVLKNSEKDITETRKTAAAQAALKERLTTDMKAALDKELTDKAKECIAADINALSEKMSTGCAHENWRGVIKDSRGEPVAGSNLKLFNYDNYSQDQIKMVSATLKDLATLEVLSSVLSSFLMNAHSTISAESPALGTAYLGFTDSFVATFLSFNQAD